MARVLRQMQPKPSRAGAAAAAAVCACVGVYYAHRLVSHASAFPLLTPGDGASAAVCGAEGWARTMHNGCFREGFLWPAILYLAASAASLLAAACLAFPGTRADHSAVSPLARLGVGNTAECVRRPPGPVTMADNRRAVGVGVVAAAAAQMAVHGAWWRYQMKYSAYPAALLETSAVVLAAAAALVLALWRSNRLVYAGLFPWPLPALAAVQLATTAAESYYSFFDGDHADLPIAGPRATPRSNLLVLAALVCAASVVLFSRAQQRPTFTRIEGPAAAAAAAAVDPAADSDGITDDDVDHDAATPLAHPSELKVGGLVETPEFRVSWFDSLSFSWANDLLRTGAARQLQYADLYRLDAVDMPVTSWRRYLRRRKPGRSLFAAMALTFAPEFGAQALLAVVRCVLEFSGPFFLQRILRTIEQSSGGDGAPVRLRTAYLDAFGLLFCGLLGTMFGNQTLWIGRHIGLRIKGLLVAELSAKTLRRRGKGSWDEEKSKKSSSSGAESAGSEGKEDDSGDGAAADGKIMNLLTADFQRVTEVSAYLDNVYAMPLSLVIGIWYMYRMLGVSSLVGLSIAVVYAPLSKALFKRLTDIEERLNALSDKRVAMITELLQGIRAVKLFGWESHFVDKVDRQREHQLSYLWLVISWWLRIGVVSSLGPMLILIVIFTTYVAVLGNTLTAEIAFTSISVFQLVRIVFEHMPGYLSWAINGYVSLGRIDSYLGQPQVQELEKRVGPSSGADAGADALGFEAADLAWDEASDSSKQRAKSAVAGGGCGPSEATTKAGTPNTECANGSQPDDEATPLLGQKPSSSRPHIAISPAPSSSASLARMDSDNDNGDIADFSLKNIDVRFPLGGLSIVAGPTGSGKSSMLSALIGEMSLTRGRILLPTEAAIESQAAKAGDAYREIVELSDEGLAIRDVAYVAQEAWLRNATIRENILFGEPYNRERYEEVLRVCALKPDLRILSAGDMTEIGERGVTLSGGQKQRVALARAVYSSRRILLIDDCLSAVDAHTAKHILMECLVGTTQLMLGRTRVLVTHHVSMCVPHAQHLVMLHEGRVVLQGAPAALQAQGALSAALAGLESSAPGGGDAEEKTIESEEEGDGQHQLRKGDDKPSREKSVNDRKPEDEYNTERLKKIAEQKGLDPDGDISALQGTLVEDEEREEGYVKFAVWKSYLSACGSRVFWVSAVVMMVLWQVVVILQDYWIRIWVTSTSEGVSTTAAASAVSVSPAYLGPLRVPLFRLTSAVPTPAHSSVQTTALQQQHSTAYWLGIYVLIGLVSVAWRTVQSFIVYYGAIRASRTLHARLLRTIVRATPRFFDSTPLGRIINRFSRDMQTIDEVTLDTIVWWFSDIVAVVGVFVIISAATPAFIVVGITVSALYAAIAYYYLSTSRELKRLESNSMSPLLSLFGELILGVSTIRAFGAKQLYIKEAINRIGTHNRPYYMVWATNRWLSVRIDFSGALVSFSCALFIIMSLDWMDAGLAGFVLSYALTFSERMLWVIRNYSSNELNMNAVERVTQYLNIEQEAALHSDPEHRPPSTWPRTGDVRLENLVIEYVPGVPVLHDISLAAAHGEKIGVVGRTGAGKSTMSLALLRFIEAASGRIVLDGVDISKIGLEDLRRNVTIIPQDPVLFNGTIRFNLDPFGEYSDEIVWDALRRTHLVRERGSQTVSTAASVAEEAAAISPVASDSPLALERMAGIFRSLDAEIKENGQNLSLGQRQLVALARALVRRSKLIIMDEATASVDFDTDDRIQRTIRGPEFADSTLFCIAHRLRTVIDYDKVLVLDKGNVAEFDTPSNLLKNDGGIFRSMCEKSGEYEYLLAAANSNSRHNQHKEEE
ncbi:hypothetical protein H4S06_000713 [Coemansia sp. BCRC 34490]|nr:hypothetical protein H4S06_000713 [Coemansia sp. BCRC 34490]